MKEKEKPHLTFEEVLLRTVNHMQAYYMAELSLSAQLNGNAPGTAQETRALANERLAAEFPEYIAELFVKPNGNSDNPKDCNVVIFKANSVRHVNMMKLQNRS